MFAFLAAAPVHDLLQGQRVHPVSLWGGFALLASVPLRIVFSHTALWHQIGSWLIG
jgi:hypothetical protein